MGTLCLLCLHLVYKYCLKDLSVESCQKLLRVLIVPLEELTTHWILQCGQSLFENQMYNEFAYKWLLVFQIAFSSGSYQAYTYSYMKMYVFLWYYLIWFWLFLVQDDSCDIEELLKKQEDFEKMIEAQEERFAALTRLTKVISLGVVFMHSKSHVFLWFLAWYDKLTSS